MKEKYFYVFVFCYFFFSLTTITLPHGVFFWLIVSYVNTLIGTCYSNRVERRVFPS